MCNSIRYLNISNIKWVHPTYLVGSMNELDKLCYYYYPRTLLLLFQLGFIFSFFPSSNSYLKK